MDINVRCPHCQEALAISQDEIDLPVNCPLCHKNFVWGEILRARERQRQSKKERIRQLQAERAANQQQTLEERRQEQARKIEAQREAAARRAQEQRNIQWHCAECRKGLCQLDFENEVAFYDDDTGKAYCRGHCPAWLYARETRDTEKEKFTSRQRAYRTRGYTHPQKRSGKLGLIAALVFIVSIVGVIVYLALPAQPPTKETEGGSKAVTSSDTSSPRAAVSAGTVQAKESPPQAAVSADAPQAKESPPQAAIPADTPQAKESPKSTATISGGAWVTLGGGQSDILRGLEIALCRESLGPELIRVRAEANEENKKKHPDWPEFYKDGPAVLLTFIINGLEVVSKHTILTAKTSIEGKYRIPDVPEGSYFLFAVYNTIFSVAYWLIPVSVKSAEPITIDLENSNMKECYNKK